MPKLPKLADVATLVTDGRFNARVAMAAVKVAITVMSEDPDTEHHGRRAPFASAVISDPLGNAPRLTAVALADDDTAAAVLAGQTDPTVDVDGTLVRRLTAAWNFLAGVTS